ncbi:MAG: serine--tRNA ligase, partial [Rickettsiales bacterium]|nr:serine--tRNA ligase [Rickettsiales bacterium]
MHNIKWIRENPEAFDEAMKRRGFAPQSTKILELDKEKRAASGDLQELQAQANAMAKEIGTLMAQGKKEEAQKVIEASKAIKEQIAAAKDGEGDEGENNAVTAILETLPNMLADEVPDGADESANQEVRQWGDVPSFDFTPKDHVELGESLNGLDFEQTAKISGARFATISGDLALLERALGDFMLDVHTQEFGYREVCPPVLVRDGAMYGTSQLPKFAEDSFQTTNGYWLIPTAEVSLTN